MLTKGAIGNLINRYKAVLKKCNLINTFGSLAVASMLVMGGAGMAGATAGGTDFIISTPATVDGGANRYAGIYSNDSGNPVTHEGSVNISGTPEGQASNRLYGVATNNGGQITVKGDTKITLDPVENVDSYRAVRASYGTIDLQGDTTININGTPENKVKAGTLIGVDVWGDSSADKKASKVTFGTAVTDEADRGNTIINITNADGYAIGIQNQAPSDNGVTYGPTELIFNNNVELNIQNVQSNGQIDAIFAKGHGNHGGADTTFNGNVTVDVDVDTPLAYGVHKFQGDNIVEFNGYNTTIDVTSTGDTYAVFNSEDEIYFKGGDENNAGVVNISATSTGSNVAVALQSQYGATIHTGEFTDVTATATADNGTAYGVRVKHTTNSKERVESANATFNGDLTVNVSGKESYGLFSSTITPADTWHHYDYPTGVLTLKGDTEITATASDPTKAHAIYSEQVDETADIPTINNYGNLTVLAGRVDGFASEFNQFEGKTDLTAIDTFFGGDVNLKGGTLAVAMMSDDEFARLNFEKGILEVSEELTSTSGMTVDSDHVLNATGNVSISATDDNSAVALNNNGSSLTLGDETTDTIALTAKGATARALRLNGGATTVTGATKLKAEGTGSGNVSGVNIFNAGTASFTGSTTVELSGSAAYMQGIKSFDTDNKTAQTMSFSGGKVTVSLDGSADYAHAIQNYKSDLDFNDEVEVDINNNKSGTESLGVAIMCNTGAPSTIDFEKAVDISVTTSGKLADAVYVGGDEGVLTFGESATSQLTAKALNGDAKAVHATAGGAIVSTADVTATAEGKTATAIYAGAKGDKANTITLGKNVTATAIGATEAYAVKAIDGSTVTLGSEGKEVSLKATSTGGDAYAVYVDGKGTSVTINGASELVGDVRVVDSTGSATVNFGENGGSIAGQINSYGTFTATSGKDILVDTDGKAIMGSGTISLTADGDIILDAESRGISMDAGRTTVAAGGDVTITSQSNDAIYFAPSISQPENNPDARTFVSISSETGNVTITGGADDNFGVSTRGKFDVVAEAGDIAITGKGRSALVNYLGSVGAATTILDAGGDVTLTANVLDSNTGTHYKEAVLYIQAGTTNIIAGGDITIADTGARAERLAVSMADAGTLTLNAGGNIAISGSIKGDEASSITLEKGVLTVAEGSVANFLGSYNQKAGSTTLTEANKFFGGAVNLTGGTMTAHTVDADKLTLGAATLHATNALNLNGANLTVGENATLIVGSKIDNAIGEDPAYQGGAIDFGTKGTITVDGGTFIADKDVVLDTDFAAKEGMAEGIVGKSGDVKLDLAVVDTENGKYKAGEYTLAQFGIAKNELFADSGENAELTFLNAVVKVNPDANVLVGATEANGVATLDSEAKPTEVAEGMSVTDMADAGHSELFYNNRVIVADAGRKEHTPLDVNQIDAKGAKFDAGIIVVGGEASEDRVVELNFTDGANVQISGYHDAGDPENDEHHGIVTTADNKKLDVKVNIEAGSTFTFGHENNSALEQSAEILSANIEGTHAVHGGNHEAHNEDDGARLTHIQYGDVTMGASGKFEILNAAATMDKLNAGGGRIYIDPAYLNVGITLSDVASEIIVGKGSVVEIGAQGTDTLKAYMEEAGLEVLTAANNGFTVEGENAVLSLLNYGNTVQMVAGGGLAVAGGIATEPAAGSYANKVDFGSGSLLVVNGDNVKNTAAITGTDAHTITVADDAKLYIANATGNATYTIADDFGTVSITDGWNGDNLFVNGLFDAEAKATEDGKGIEVTTTNKDVDEAFPGVIPANALNKLIEDGVKNDAPEAGKRFLSLATDPTVIADTGKAVDTINEVSRAAVTAGVQNTSLRIADAASNTVLDHLSLSQHDASSAIHADGVDFWAAPMYGNLYTSGMTTSGSSVRGQFGGLALGADLEAGQFLGGKFRLGAAINGGGGQSETKGTATSTQNDYDFGGLNFYAGWNSGSLNVIASVGYGFGNHEVEMGIPVAGVNKAKADIDTSAFTADLRAEYQLKTPYVDILPHAGIRYTALKTDAHDLKVGGSVLNSVQSDTQNIVQFPLGVTLSKDFNLAGWTVKPSADVSVIPAAGDKKATTKVNFSGLDAWDSVNTRVMDSTSWAGTIGVQAEKGNMTFGLNYGVQASSHETDQNIQVKFGWKF